MSTFEWVLYDTSKRSFQTSSRDTFCNIMRVDTTIQRSAVTSHVWSVATPINCEVIHSLSVVDKLNVWLVFTIYGWHVSILYKQFCIGIPNYLVVVYGCIGFFFTVSTYFTCRFTYYGDHCLVHNARCVPNFPTSYLFPIEIETGVLCVATMWW